MPNANQLKFLRLNLFLLIGWAVLSVLIYPLFGSGVSSALFGGGILYLFAALFQGLFYFSFRGAAQATRILFALKLGSLVKFLLVILLYALVAAGLVAAGLPAAEFLPAITCGIVIMHFAQAFAAAGMLR